MTDTVRLEALVRVYDSTGSVVRALDGVTAGFAPGTFTAVMGPSGSGKSTLLQCAAGLDRLGLGDRLGHRPAQLSGGQRQRVAIARALITDPAVIFADEPTGALDTRSARDVLELLRAAVADFGRTVVMVTHDPVAAAYADAVLFLADGRIVGRMDAPRAEAVAERLAHLADAAAGPRLVGGAA